MKHQIFLATKKAAIAIILLYNSIYGFSQYTQTIKGKVIDQASQATLPGATVVVLNIEPVRGTTTDMSGHFSLTGISVGRIHIRVSYLGYEPYDINSLMVTSGKEVILDIELKESINNLDEVIVSGYKKDRTINTMSMISARSFSVEETRRYAGGLDDPGRLISAFAGVADFNVESNGIVVRGNAPWGVIYRVEGIEVENPNHFAGEDFLGGGFVSILNSNVLGNSDFFTGAFPAEYGNALSAVLDMNIRTGNQDKREYAFQVGALGLDFLLEGPFRKKKKASYILNYRYSTFGLVQSFLPESVGLPVYQDLSFKLNFPYKKGTLSIWGAGGIDAYRYGNISDENTGSMYINDAGNTGFIGIKNKHFINSSAYTCITLLANASGKSNVLMERYTDNKFYNRELIDNLTGKYSASWYVNKKFGAKHTMRSGFVYSDILYNMDYKYAEKLPNNPLQVVKGNGHTGLLQTYLQSKIYLTKQLTLNAGVNSQYLLLNSDYSIELRAGINYRLGQKNIFSIAYGKHSQMQPIAVYFVRNEENGITSYPNKKLDFTRSHHFIIGYDHNLNENTRLKVEPFYQYLTHVPVIEDSSFSIVNLTDLNTFNDILVSEGEAQNIGIDFTLERFLQNGFYYLGTLSLFDSRYLSGDGVWRNTRYNKNIIANILVGKEWNISKQNFLGFNGRLYLKNGDRTSPFNQEASVEAGEIVYDETNLFEKQYPFTYRCDISITYTVNKAKYTSKFALQLMNVFGSIVTYYDKYNTSSQKASTEGDRMILPLISWKIEF